MDIKRDVWAEIDRKALSYNIRKLKSLLSKKTKIMAVVKANAYGHGAVECAKTFIASGAHRLGVALFEEALELARAKISVPLHILNEPPPRLAREIVRNNFIPTVYSWDLAKSLADSARRMNKKIKVHLKVDTGMHRAGLPPEEVLDFIKKLNELPSLEVEGIFTHFAMADDINNDFTEFQISRFNNIFKSLSRQKINIPVRHAANSAATMAYPHSHFDMVRLGISLYGLFPSFSFPRYFELKPALCLKTRIASIRRINGGEGVSYGLTYRAKKETLIATLPLGYADGYTRLYSNRAKVLVEGKKAPVAGNVCMDQFMIDIGNIKNAHIGSEVVLIGKQGEATISADELAKRIGTINYEIVTIIDKRIPRIYIN